jgi:hypothetical protein
VHANRYAGSNSLSLLSNSTSTRRNSAKRLTSPSPKGSSSAKKIRKAKTGGSFDADDEKETMPRTKSANQEKLFHYSEAMLFGVICNSCATKVIVRGNGLLPPSAKVIKAHWEKGGCSVGSPVVDNIAKSLEEDMKKLRRHAPFDLETVAKVVADHFPPGSKEMDAYVCKDCLFHSKDRTDFNKHFNTDRSPGLGCGETNRNPSHRSKIIVGKYGIALPKEIYSYMMDGRYCWRKEGEADETTKSDCDWMLRWCPPTSPPQEALAPNHFWKQSPASTAGSAVPAVSPSPYPSADPVGDDNMLAWKGAELSIPSLSPESFTVPRKKRLAAAEAACVDANHSICLHTQKRIATGTGKPSTLPSFKLCRRAGSSNHNYMHTPTGIAVSPIKLSPTTQCKSLTSLEDNSSSSSKDNSVYSLEEDGPLLSSEEGSMLGWEDGGFDTDIPKATPSLLSSEDTCVGINAEFPERPNNETLPSDTRLENVDKVYKIVHKFTGALGGMAEGGPVYGELTTGSMNKVVNLMIEHTGFCESSCFIDIGCGLGKPNLHVAQYPGVALSVGVEIRAVRHFLGMTNLNAVLDAAKTNPSIGHKCYLIRADIMSFKCLDPFTHVYMFDIG